MADRPRQSKGRTKGGPPAARHHSEPNRDLDARPASLDDVLDKASDLQRLVPGAVLVGGAAAAFHAHHRLSFDDDHVLVDLNERFDSVLGHLEALDEWSTARVKAGRIILGELGGIETGIRQLIRQRPLETETVEVRGKRLVVPTIQETLRMKAWLALTRNQTRDYLDIAALADTVGIAEAARTLTGIDDYYSDVNERPEAVASQLVRQLGDPRPRDSRTTTQLASYRQLDPKWHDWSTVRGTLLSLARAMAGAT